MEIPQVDVDCEYCVAREVSIQSLPSLAQFFASCGLYGPVFSIALMIADAPYPAEDGHFADCPIKHPHLARIPIYRAGPYRYDRFSAARGLRIRDHFAEIRTSGLFGDRVITSRLGTFVLLVGLEETPEYLRKLRRSK
jgi:hypothetical protein